MKKIILCIMLCTSYLQSMEQETTELPDDVQKQIVIYSAVPNDIDATIHALKTISLITKKFNQIINEHYGNVGTLDGFATCLAKLSKQFPTMTRDQIAKKFNLKISKEYINLGEQLLQAADIYDSQVRLNTTTELINQGADAGYNATEYLWSKFIMGGPIIYGPCRIQSALRNALAHACKQEDEESMETVKLLLKKAVERGGMMINLFKIIEYQGKQKKADLLAMFKTCEVK